MGVRNGPEGSGARLTMAPRSQVRAVPNEPLDPLVVAFIESLAVSDFWEDYVAELERIRGTLDNAARGNLREILDRAAEPTID